MSFKIANTTTDTVFVISVNGGALWEFEPGIWRTVDHLTDREWEAIDSYLKVNPETGLCHNSTDSKRTKGLVPAAKLSEVFKDEDNYDKVSDDPENPSKGEKASGKLLEESWELTKATLKFEGDKVLIGKDATPTVEGLKGYKIVNGARKGNEVAYTQGYRISRLWSEDDKVTVNEKTGTVKGVTAGTAVKIKAEIVATGNDTGKVVAEASVTVAAS